MAEKDGGKAGRGDAGGGDSGGPNLSQGFEIAAGIGLGVVIGMWWDRRHGSSPWGLLVGMLLGCAAGTYLLIKETMRSDKD
jgi:F0F1-type ATP synthase assembly protein I